MSGQRIFFPENHVSSQKSIDVSKKTFSLKSNRKTRSRDGSLYRKESSNEEILRLLNKMGVKFADKILDSCSKTGKGHRASFYNNMIYTILISNMEYKKSREAEARKQMLKMEEIQKHNQLNSVLRSTGRTGNGSEALRRIQGPQREAPQKAEPVDFLPVFCL